MSTPPKSSGSALPPYKQNKPRRRASSIYTQANATPIQPVPSTFGSSQSGSSTFYSFPRLPDPVDVEEDDEPVRSAGLPSGSMRKMPIRTASFSERIASGIRSLLGTTSSKPSEKKPLLSLSKAEYEAGESQKTSDGANIFCQHILDERCQCAVTMPIAVGRNYCQTCADGECAASAQEGSRTKELKCAHMWLDTCQCTRGALWVTGDSLCGPCWYGLCSAAEAKEEAKGEEGTSP